jgi:uncharacterized membrane protein
MANVQKTIDVPVPVHEAYNQWTQFETFPQFMEGVKEVRQTDHRHLRWRAEVGGHEVEWDSEITEQISDTRIAWRSIGGRPNSGVVDFHPTAEDRTQVTLLMEAEPEGFTETVGDKLGVLDHRVEGDLKRFRDFIARRGTATGAHHGQINPEPPYPSSS